MIRICPQPAVWHDVFQRLAAFAKTRRCEPAEPPFPLILNGWAYSNDTDKLHRWEMTVGWAQRNGCENLVTSVAESDFYCVEQPTTYTVGPMGGPMYREWDFQTRTKPEDSVLASLMGLLKSKWHEIAGNRLAAITSPEEFAGSKARRLVIRAKWSELPPWGTWTELSYDEAKRRTFTTFREAVNTAIAPHEVDHIDFVPE